MNPAIFQSQCQLAHYHPKGECALCQSPLRTESTPPASSPPQRPFIGVCALLGCPGVRAFAFEPILSSLGQSPPDLLRVDLYPQILQSPWE